MKIRVNETTAVIAEDEPLTSGTVGKRVVFEFSPEWDELTRTAIFKSGDRIRAAVGIDDSCVIPWEVLETPDTALYIGVLGTKNGGTVIIPTVFTPAKQILPGAVPSPAELESTLTVAEQLTEKIEDTQHEIDVMNDLMIDAFSEFDERISAKQDALTFDTAPTDESENPVTSGGIFDWTYGLLSQKQNTVTADGVLVGDGIGGISAAVFDDAPTEDSDNLIASGAVKSALDEKQDALTFDTVPTEESANPVTSGGIKAYVDGHTPTVDGSLSSVSENPVQNKVITAAIGSKADGETVRVMGMRLDNLEASAAGKTYDFVDIAPAVDGTEIASGYLRYARLSSLGGSSYGAFYGDPPESGHIYTFRTKGITLADGNGDEIFRYTLPQSILDMSEYGLSTEGGLAAPKCNYVDIPNRRLVKNVRKIVFDTADKIACWSTHGGAHKDTTLAINSAAFESAFGFALQTGSAQSRKSLCCSHFPFLAAGEFDTSYGLNWMNSTALLFNPLDKFEGETMAEKAESFLAYLTAAHR